MQKNLKLISTIKEMTDGYKCELEFRVWYASSYTFATEVYMQ